MSMNSFYTEGFYKALHESSRSSARQIVPLILELTQPQSVVDVGCGLGVWLSVFEEFGVEEYLGIDGDHVNQCALEIPRDNFLSFDLRNPLQLDRKFDLVLSLEVAEHLPVECAETFIDSVTSLGPVVLFSAAIPLQGGSNHVNEQWPHYWAQHFHKRGYLVVDCLRKKMWNNENVEPWYAQNMLIFVRQDRIDGYPLLERELERMDVSRLAMVHPGISRQRFVGKKAEAKPPNAETTHVARVEVTEPIPHISAPLMAERLHCTVKLEGACIGVIELPICEGLVPSHVLADAIAARFAWPILARFFEHTVYRDLRIEREPTGLSVRRGALLLGGELPDNGDTFWSQLHDRVGWTVFLQEIWGKPAWPRERFYDPQAPEEATTRYRAANNWPAVEVSRDLPDLQVSGRKLDVVLTVGGVALGVVTVPVKRNTVRAQELRVALTRTSGFELCRAAVREGLLGQPMASPASLRDRLAAAASEAAQFPGWPGAPGSARAFGGAPSPGASSVVLGRRAHKVFGTSASRRAILPAAAARELVDAAKVAGDPVIQVPRPGEPPERVVYASDLLRRPSRCTRESIAGARVIQLLRLVKRLRIFLNRLVLRLGGSYQRNGDTQTVVTDQLPILRYQRVAPTGSPGMARYPVTPKAFEEQLGYLRDAGFYSVRLEEWRAAMETYRPLPGRAVLITFDGGHLDFLTYAWPLLRRYGFSATIFLVADEVGKGSSWDHVYGEEVALLGWKEIRQLQNDGIEFGSLSASHRPLTSLSLAEVVREGARSRAILDRGLGVPVKAFAYPYGDVDRVIEHLIGACGYVFGLSMRQDRSMLYDSLLALPRIEVIGSDGLQEFVTKIGS